MRMKPPALRYDAQKSARDKWEHSELALSTAPPQGQESPEDFERRMATMLRDFDKKSPKHPPDCICPRCLYSVYEESKKGPGPLWSRDLFLIAWLIHETKLAYLLREKTKYVGKAKREGCIEFRRFANSVIEELNHYGNARLYRYNLKDYDKAPSWKLVRKVLEFNRPTLADHLRGRNLARYAGRVKTPAFRRVLAAITKEKLRILHGEHERLGPPLPGWEPADGLRLAMRIRDYILSRPTKMATRRELQRKFRVRRAEDVDAAVDWLRRAPLDGSEEDEEDDDKGYRIYHKQVAHKFQRKRGGYRNKRTFVFAARKPQTEKK